MEKHAKAALVLEGSLTRLHLSIHLFTGDPGP